MIVFWKWSLACVFAACQLRFISLFRLGLEAKKEENLADWYSQVRVTLHLLENLQINL